MKKSRFTEEQIVFALKQADPVTSVPEACRKQGIYDPTFYTWRKKWRNISYRTEAHAVACGWESQAEDAGCRSEPRQGHAEDVLAKKNWRWRVCANGAVTCRYAIRRCCFALRVSRSSLRYRSVSTDDSALRSRISGITQTRVHYCYRRVHVMLRREGLRDKLKRIYRLYSEQGLYPNHAWGMDFLSDALFDGHRLRQLTVIDLYTRESTGICVGQNLRSTEIVEMNTIALTRLLPQLLKTDNGSEFAGKWWASWCMKGRAIKTFPGREHRGTMPQWSRSMAVCSLRQEWLNKDWYMSLEVAWCRIEAWRIYYNQRRPYYIPGWMTPSKFAEKSACWQNMQSTWSLLFLITTGPYSGPGSTNRHYKLMVVSDTGTGHHL